LYNPGDSYVVLYPQLWLFWHDGLWTLEAKLTQPVFSVRFTQCLRWYTSKRCNFRCSN
jgi:hypothetical protein